MKPTTEPQTHYLNLCRGAAGGSCPHALEIGEGISGRIQEVVETSGWPAFVLGQHGDKLHRHHGFQIHLSACPNGCSRPHIADIGFIRACVPSVDADTCTSCGDCAESCPDTAISMESGLPEIDFDLCMRCGHCVHICPVESMHSVEEGWRVLVGGRLGRHPKLAQELPGLFSDEQALDILDRALHLHMDRYGQRKRFGAVLDETGIKTLLEPSA